MTTLSISGAFRHIAAAFGNERAQQKLAQQKRDKSLVTLVSIKHIDRDKMYPIPRFESGLTGHTRPTLLEIRKELAPVSMQLLTKGSTPPEQRRVDERARDTLDRRPRSAPTQETVRVAASPSRIAAGAASTNRISAESAQQGGWLHNHWKPSAAGIAALETHLDTTDAPKAAAVASPTLREDAGNAGTFPGSLLFLHSEILTAPFRIARPKLTESEARTAAPAAPAGKPTLAAKNEKVLEHKEVIRTAKRRAPAIPVTQQAAVAVAKHTSTTPAQHKVPLAVIATPAMAAATATATTTTTASPPPPPPLPLDLSPMHVGPASRGLFAELKNVTLAKSTSLDENATEAFGTRTGAALDTPDGTLAGENRRGLIQPKRHSAPSASDELRQAVALRREKLGYKPEKPKVASVRPTAIRPHSDPRPKSADSIITPAKPKGEVFGRPNITAALKLDMVAELRARFALRGQ